MTLSRSTAKPLCTVRVGSFTEKPKGLVGHRMANADCGGAVVEPSSRKGWSPFMTMI